jgi:hypothetical protein
MRSRTAGIHREAAAGLQGCRLGPRGSRAPRSRRLSTVAGFGRHATDIIAAYLAGADLPKQVGAVVGTAGVEPTTPRRTDIRPVWTTALASQQLRACLVDGTARTASEAPIGTQQGRTGNKGCASPLQRSSDDECVCAVLVEPVTANLDVGQRQNSGDELRHGNALLAVSDCHGMHLIGSALRCAAERWIPHPAKPWPRRLYLAIDTRQTRTCTDLSRTRSSAALAPCLAPLSLSDDHPNVARHR